MRTDPVELVRRGFEAFNSRDFATVSELCDPDVEWRPPAEVPGAVVYHGPDGVVAAMRDMLDAFSDLQAVEDRLIPADDESVVALYRWRGSSSSGLSVDEFDVKVGALLELRDGRFLRARFFTDWETPQRLAGILN